MKLRQQPSSRNSSRSKTRRNSKCCSHPTARTKPKAGTGTNCNLNAQEEDKQHIELQKQHPQMAEQAPPHEIASAALNRKKQQKEQQKQQQMLLIHAHTPDPAPKPKAGTGTNCNLNAQEQGKQHIELQKQHLDLPEQAPPHEIASAALQQKQQQKQQQTEQQMLLMLQSPNQTKSRNRHQLQFECTGTRQAAHRIAEAAARTGRAGASTWNYVSSPPAETAAEAKQDATADAAHTPRPERNPKQELAPTAT